MWFRSTRSSMSLACALHPLLGKLTQDVARDPFTSLILRCEKEVINRRPIAVQHWRRLGHELETRNPLQPFPESFCELVIRRFLFQIFKQHLSARERRVPPRFIAPKGCHSCSLIRPCFRLISSQDIAIHICDREV